MPFLKKKKKLYSEFVRSFFYWQVPIGSDNGVVMNCQQAVTWNNADLGPWPQTA